MLASHPLNFQFKLIFEIYHDLNNHVMFHLLNSQLQRVLIISFYGYWVTNLF
jgi:hypothetical protein